MVSTIQLALPLAASAALIGAAVAQPVAEGGRKFDTAMTGANECNASATCNLGDPDGAGTAHIVLNYGQGRICWELTVTNIATATASHIHRAPVGVAGPIVVPLVPPPSSGSSNNCTDVSRDLIKDIIQHPEAFYVNVHNATYPAGAIRGQLGK
jgi:hypothetical protein